MTCQVRFQSSGNISIFTPSFWIIRFPDSFRKMEFLLYALFINTSEFHPWSMYLSSSKISKTSSSDYLSHLIHKSHASSIDDIGCTIMYTQSFDLCILFFSNPTRILWIYFNNIHFIHQTFSFHFFYTMKRRLQRLWLKA